VATASADGSVCLWDVTVSDGFPVARWPVAHGAEVSSVDWNFIDKGTFLSSSWDGTARLWHPERPGAAPLAAFNPTAPNQGGGPGPPPSALYNAIWWERVCSANQDERKADPPTQMNHVPCSLVTSCLPP